MTPGDGGFTPDAAGADGTGGVKTEQVKEYFGDNSRYLGDPFVRETRRLALEALRVEIAGKKLLDVGCGDGSMSLPWAGTAAELTLVDLSGPMTKLARDAAARLGAGGVRVLEGDFLTGDVGADYDVVLCLGVLAHVPDLDQAVERLASLVRPGGVVVAQLTDADRPLGALLWSWGRVRSRQEGRYEALRLGAAAVAASAARHGLTCERTLRYSLMLPGSGRAPARLVRALERASVRSGWLRPLGADLLMALRKGPGRS